MIEEQPSPSRPDVSIVIVSWNTRDLLAQALQSVFEQTRGVRFRVFVVDNASTDGSADMVRERFPQVQVIESEKNLGFARANNVGIRRTRGRYVLLLNPDTIILDDAVSRIVRFMDEHPRCGMATAKVLNPDRTFQTCYGEMFPSVWSFLTGGSRLSTALRSALLSRRYFEKAGLEDDDESTAHPVTWVMGAFMMVRRAVIEQVGLLDEHLFMYGEEADWCYRATQAGWEMWYSPAGEIIHLGGQSTRQVDEAKTVDWLMTTRYYFFRKHRGARYALLCYIVAIVSAAVKLAWFSLLSPLPVSERKANHLRRKRTRFLHHLRWHVTQNPLRLMRAPKQPSEPTEVPETLKRTAEPVASGAGAEQ